MYSFVCCFFFFKQKTAYEMRISDWSSDVCSSDLGAAQARQRVEHLALFVRQGELDGHAPSRHSSFAARAEYTARGRRLCRPVRDDGVDVGPGTFRRPNGRRADKIGRAHV